MMYPRRDWNSSEYGHLGGKIYFSGKTFGIKKKKKAEHHKSESVQFFHWAFSLEKSQRYTLHLVSRFYALGIAEE